jgi:RNA polymerase sigma-70 factor (ECF subfamily)
MMGKEDGLIRRLRAGDRGTYEHVVSAYHGAMTRLARSIIGDAAAEEIVQEAWIKAIRSLPGFEGRSSLRVWLLRIVRNEALSTLRKISRAPTTESFGDDETDGRYNANGSWRVPPSAWSGDTPEALVAVEEMRAVVDKTLAVMPSLQRSVLTLRDVDEISLNEICNILDISASNARVLLHRARMRLWLAIDQYQQGK